MGVEVAEHDRDHPDPEVGVDQPGRQPHLTDHVGLVALIGDQGPELAGQIDGLAQTARDLIGQRAQTGRSTGQGLDGLQLDGGDRVGAVDRLQVVAAMGYGTGVALLTLDHQGNGRADREAGQWLVWQAVEHAAEPATAARLAVGVGRHGLGHRHEVAEGRVVVADAFDDGQVATVPQRLHVAEVGVEAPVAGHRQHVAGRDGQVAPGVVVGPVVVGHERVQPVVAAGQGHQDEHPVVRTQGGGAGRGLGQPAGEQGGRRGHTGGLEEATAVEVGTGQQAGGDLGRQGGQHLGGRGVAASAGGGAGDPGSRG